MAHWWSSKCWCSTKWKYGKFTNDPNKLYDDSNGAILPLGGIFGHKGYALTILIEILAGGLTSSGYVNEKNKVIYFIVISPNLVL